MDTPLAGRPLPASSERLAGDAATHVDWLRHTLTVSGPAACVARFQQAARGHGTILWQLDLDREEARLLAPMITEGVEARLLAHQLREVIETNHARALAAAQRPGGCPLDLHRLVPLPDPILRLEEDDPEATRWLWAHWGTTLPLRQVRVLGRHTDRRLRRSARFVVEFWSADWTPWHAVRRLRRDWAALILDIRPSYDDG